MLAHVGTAERAHKHHPRIDIELPCNVPAVFETKIDHRDLDRDCIDLVQAAQLMYSANNSVFAQKCKA